MSSAFLVPAGGGDQLTALGSTYRTMTDGTQVAGAYSLVEEQFWGATTPLHAHPAAEEAFYLLGGTVEVWVDGRTSEAARGAFVVVPRDATHGLRRVSDEPVLMLTLISPPGLERVFAEVARIGEEELLADPERLAALAAAHGTRIVGDYPVTGGG